MASNLEISLESVTKDLGACLEELRSLDGAHQNIAETLKTVCANLDAVIKELHPSALATTLVASRAEVLKVLARVEPDVSSRN